ncbi:MAG: ribosome silencing factor [Deltaproteobacteria bacterium]|nr:ribosome silencing factor [Deltaproteobacteria bacterium]
MCAARAAHGKKAEDIVILDIRNLVTWCDFFVLSSVSNPRLAVAVADAVTSALEEAAGVRPIGVEGLERARWVLLDFGDVVVHVFDESLRVFYDLEGLWIDAPRITLPETEAAGEVAAPPPP